MAALLMKDGGASLAPAKPKPGDPLAVQPVKPKPADQVATR
jgi:hypothetical protein